MNKSFTYMVGLIVEPRNTKFLLGVLLDTQSLSCAQNVSYRPLMFTLNYTVLFVQWVQPQIIATPKTSPTECLLHSFCTLLGWRLLWNTLNFLINEHAHFAFFHFFKFSCNKWSFLSTNEITKLKFWMVCCLVIGWKKCWRSKFPFIAPALRGTRKPKETLKMISKFSNNWLSKLNQHL